MARGSGLRVGALREGVDVPDPPLHSMCQVCLALRGHRNGLNLRYRHPLGSLRPFVARFRLTYYDVWSAPAPLGFVQGAVALLTGERDRVRVRRPRFMLALWSGRGGCYSSIIPGDGCNVFSGGFFYGGDV